VPPAGAAACPAASAFVNEHVAADAHAVAVTQFGGDGNTPLVDERAIAAAQIAQHHFAAHHLHSRVAARHGLAFKFDAVIHRTPNRHRAGERDFASIG